MPRVIAALESRAVRWCRHPRHVALVVAGLTLITLAFALHGVAAPLRTDYVAMLTGADVLHGGGCLYCHGAQLAAQQELLHQRGIAFDAFLEPPLIAALYVPLLGVPPAGGFAIVLTTSLLLVAGAAWLTARAVQLPAEPAHRALVAGAFLAVPVAWIYALGQTDALVLFALALALWLRSAGRSTAAGALLAVACLKPQTAVMVLPMLVIAQQWRMLAGALAVGAVLTTASLVLAGPAAVAQWTALAATNGPQLSTALGLPSLVGWVFGATPALVAALALAALGVGAAWHLRPLLVARPEVAVAAGITLSVLIAPHVYAYDLAVLAIPLLVIGRRNLGAGLLLAGSLSGAHLIDTFLLWSGPHVETVVELAIALRLASVAGGHSAVAAAVSAQRSTVSESCAGVVSALTR